MRKLVIFLYKGSIVFLSISIAVFSLSLVEVTTKAQVFAPNTFVSAKDKLLGKEGSTEANLSADYLQGANKNKVFNEFTEGTISKDGFYIRIDKIDLFKAIVKDVDPRSKEIYKKSWEKGVSHGMFTAYPNQIGITYLFSHALGDKSSALSENAWFSNLDQVGMGELVIIYYEGNKYTYEVNEIRAVSSDATGFYTGSSPVSKVRMQYCGPPTGSLAKRTLVDAVLVDTETI